jgi:hypothetical protein
LSENTVRDQLYQELQEKANMLVYGIRIEDDVIDRTGAGVTVKEGGRLPDKKPAPSSFLTPGGLSVSIRRNADSDYEIMYEQGAFSVTKKGHALYDKLKFEKRPLFYDKLTSDGKKMNDIISIVSNGCAAVWYSNECAFKERGEDCIFCGINAGPGDVFLKTSQQIAQSIKAAYDEGAAWRIDFTGGVISERREIDYYADAMESVTEALGRRDLVAAACISAPRDFDNITRLKGAGFSIITMNIEVWDKNFFKSVCPGKARTVGWENWVKALRFGAETFGFGQVRCNFVTGIEPKKSTLEGIEYLASFGAIGNANIFGPVKGTPLEGHRCPTPEWNLDLHEKAADILRRSGITFEQATNCHPSANSLFHDFWRIKDGLLPIFQEAGVISRVDAG